MKHALAFAILCALCSACNAAPHTIFVGFDLSETAMQHGSNTYHAGWAQILGTVRGGDHVYAALINERGFGNAAPPIDFTIRPYTVFDKSADYQGAVQAKLKLQENALDAIVRTTTPAHGTEIIGFLHTVATILATYPPGTNKQVILFTDGLEQGSDINLFRQALSQAEITKLIEIERRAGRLPTLTGMNIWFVTGPSMHGQVKTDQLLRIEAFWRAYIQACGGNLEAFSPVLSNF